jgi:hypothetical protein
MLKSSENNLDPLCCPDADVMDLRQFPIGNPPEITEAAVASAHQ